MAALAQISYPPNYDDELRECFRIPHDSPPRWMVVLTAYLDESGQESNSYVFIAGFLGNDEQWRRCATEWKVGLGGRKGLHMKRLRWGQPRTERLLQRLGPIPHQCGLEPLLGGVRVSDYEDLIKGTIDEQLMAGYISALYPLVIQTLRWIPSHERVEFIFEAQDRYEQRANLVLSDIANNQRGSEFLTSDGISKLANWRFVPKDSTIFTQPADYFAYAVTQIYRDKKSEKSRLCMPICPDGDKSTAIGSVMSRKQVRDITEVTRAFVNWEAISGIDLKPKTDEQRKAFNQIVQQMIDLDGK
jgi:hypothetical protein